MKNGQQPILPHDLNFQGTLGLTKREYFAGLAMQGILANSNFDTDSSWSAHEAIKQADKLLELL